MYVDILKTSVLNISFLILLAYLITRIRFVKKFITQERPSLSARLAMTLVFGIIGIISTYSGVPVYGAIANTRVIGIIAGGILGGPGIGLAAGVIAGAHRYFVDAGGLTALACSISTVVAGGIGGLYFIHARRRRNEMLPIFLITLFAEICQMLIILIIARPFEQALEVVKIIFMPMVVFNSAGAALFINIFDSVFIERDKEAAKHVRLVLNIADHSLPFLRHGLYSNPDLEKVLRILLKESWISGAALTDGSRVLSCLGLRFDKDSALPRICARTVDSKSIQTAEAAPEDDPLYDSLNTHSAVCAPLTQKGGEIIGSLLVIVPKYRLTHEVEYVFVGGLAKLFSTQLELAQLDHQKKLLQKAEFTALQSQINPHFLFNALSTITAFCREKPERARELLIVLSTYFRNTLKTGDYMISLGKELEHVKSYLELEKARFEDKLMIEFDLTDDLLDCTVPSFILQPIVENAVKHGAMSNGKAGRVTICAHRTPEGTQIAVTDNGPGIPEDVIDRLRNDLGMDSGSVGMINVNKRLKSIYGVENGLVIQALPCGTRISMTIPDKSPGFGYDGEEDAS